jgi:hypothetical protein
MDTEKLLKQTEDEIIDFRSKQSWRRLCNPGDKVNEKMLGRIEGQAVELLGVDILLDAVEQEGVAPRNNLAIEYNRIS